MKYDLDKYFAKSDYHSTIPICKIKNYQDKWIKDNSNKKINKEDLNSCLDTISHRFKSCIFYLEILWQQYEYIFSNKIDNIDNYNFISLISLESFFIQSRSFIEATQKYSLIYLAIEKQHKDLKTFYKLLKKSGDYKAQKIENLYKEKVFKKGCFGNDIKLIRDKIIHKSYIKQINFLDEFENKKPLISNKTYEEFCQKYSNEVFYFLINWTELLFDIKWQSG